jgi:hypothetical protein
MRKTQAGALWRADVPLQVAIVTLVAALDAPLPVPCRFWRGFVAAISGAPCRYFSGVRSHAILARLASAQRRMPTS